MNLPIQKLNLICFTICIVCIVLGVLFALVLIWVDIENEIAWKGFLTIGVFFFGSALTMSVTRMIEKRSDGR